MAITEFLTNGTSYLNKVLDWMIFWKDWSDLSKNLLIWTVILLFVGYTWLMSEMKNQNSVLKRRGRI